MIRYDAISYDKEQKQIIGLLYRMVEVPGLAALSTSVYLSSLDLTIAGDMKNGTGSESHNMNSSLSGYTDK